MNYTILLWSLSIPTFWSFFRMYSGTENSGLTPRLPRVGGSIMGPAKRLRWLTPKLFSPIYTDTSYCCELLRFVCNFKQHSTLRLSLKSIVPLLTFCFFRWGSLCFQYYHNVSWEVWQYIVSTASFESCGRDHLGLHFISERLYCCLTWELCYRRPTVCRRFDVLWTPFWCSKTLSLPLSAFELSKQQGGLVVAITEDQDSTNIND